MYTSSYLQVGCIYSRKELATRFCITDATIRNGVFKPKTHSSVWLFVTLDKPADRVQYRDRLEGSVLFWDGQTSGRTDHLIINHQSDGNELLLFLRRHKLEYEAYGFRLCGRLYYQSHSGSCPAHFVLSEASDISESTLRHLKNR